MDNVQAHHQSMTSERQKGTSAHHPQCNSRGGLGPDVIFM